jgi:hypothetical protein
MVGTYKSFCVTGWKDEKILEAVKREVSMVLDPLCCEVALILSQISEAQPNFRIDQDDKSHVAVIVNFDGPDGIIIIDEDWMKTGREKPHSGVYLYITGKGWIMGDERPDVRFVHKV